MAEIISDQVFSTKIVEGSDSYVYKAQNSDMTFNHCFFNAMDAEWSFKASFLYNLTFNDCTFENGIERTFDAVRGGLFTFNRCTFRQNESIRKRNTSKWTLQDNCDIGLKAGVRDVVFNDCSLNDLLLGDYSIYDQNPNRLPTRRISLNNCVNPNGGEIIVRGLFADGVKTDTATKVDQIILPRPITAVYFFANRKLPGRDHRAADMTLYPIEML